MHRQTPLAGRSLNPYTCGFPAAPSLGGAGWGFLLVWEAHGPRSDKLRSRANFTYAGRAVVLALAVSEQHFDSQSQVRTTVPKRRPGASCPTSTFAEAIPGTLITSSRYPSFKISLYRSKVSGEEASKVKQLCASGVRRGCVSGLDVSDGHQRTLPAVSMRPTTSSRRHQQHTAYLKDHLLHLNAKRASVTINRETPDCTHHVYRSLFHSQNLQVCFSSAMGALWRCAHSRAQSLKADFPKQFCSRVTNELQNRFEAPKRQAAGLLRTAAETRKRQERCSSGD